MVLTLLAMETFFNHGATYGFGREERWIYRRGWYLNRRGQKPLNRKTFNNLQSKWKRCGIDFSNV